MAPLDRSALRQGGRLAPCYLVIYLSIQVSSWIAFAVVANGAWSACAFASVGAIIMSSWALQRHEKYVAADSADYPRHARTPIVPGFNVPLPRALTDALAKSY